ncbi:MAG: lipopolysaccharide biosynthesis protein [Rubrivivax sp.]|nr:lipopolysaccharide biosynthesis protein [Rubrivivax sp.]
MTRPDLGQLDTTGRLRRLFGDSAIYGIAGAINKLIALVTFPLLARQLSVGEYGTVDAFMIATNWLALVIIWGVDSAVARLLLDHPEDHERAQIFSQCLVWLALATLVIAPAVWLAAEPLSRQLGQESSARSILPLVCLQLPFLSVFSVSQSALRWTFQRRRYLTLSLGSAGVTAGLLVTTSLVTALQPRHVFMIALIVQVLFAGLALAFMRRWLVLPRSLAHWRHIAPIALPLGLIAVAAAFLPLLERAIVDGTPGLAEGQALGLYAAGAKVAGLLALPILAFQSGWGPFVIALSREREAARTLNAALLVYTWIIGIAVLALSTAGPWIVRLLASERYAQSSQVIFPLAMAMAVQGAGWILEAGINIAKRTHMSLVAYAAMLALFAPLALLLRATWGVTGVAFALLAGQAAFAALSAVLAQRAHRLDWRAGPAAALLAITAATGIAQCAMGSWFGDRASLAIGVAGVSALLGLASWPGPVRRSLGMLLRPPTAR